MLLSNSTSQVLEEAAYNMTHGRVSADAVMAVISEKYKMIIEVSPS